MERENKTIILRVIISLLIFAATFFVPNIGLTKLFLFLIVYLIIGFDVVKEAFENTLHGKLLDETFLMFIATLGAFAVGEYHEAIVVMLLYQIGECLQDYAVDKSRDAISDLMDIRPDFANIEKDGVLVAVNPEEVNVNDIIIVNAGEKIPLDGIIIEGNSFLDTSSITGESVLKSVTVGATAYSGTINKTSMLKLRVTKKYEDSTVSRILELVEDANEKKAKAEKFITKFARYYTPIVVLLAVLLAFLPPLFIKGASLIEYIHRACSFLVISCPCALVISIPLGFFAGLGGASRNGILIKGSNYIEALSKIKTVVFDKTGTLTKGTFEVTKIHSESISNEELLRISAYAENYSKHPIALSIKNAYGNAINGDNVSDSTEIPGKGIMVNVENRLIHIGNKELMNSIDINPSEPSEIGTIIYVAIDMKYAGYLVISDIIKKEAKKAITELKANKINTAMLTGDNAQIANQVAKELSINDVYAELFPNDKVSIVESFLEDFKKYGIVAFVGDGINDAPVLTRANIGIAMGGLGSDSAIEAADVVIMDDNIVKINTAIKIAKKTLMIVKQNIWFAICVKLIVLILGSLGLASMWEAVFADVGVSILAILNAIRAFHIQE